MAHTPIPDWSTIDAYLAGTLSPAGQVAFEQWCLANPDEWVTLQRVDRAILVGSGTQDRDAIAAFIERVQRARVAHDVTEGLSEPSSEMRLTGSGTQRVRLRALGFSGQALKRGISNVGTQTLRGLRWSFGVVATLVAAFFVVQSGSSSTPGLTRSYTTGVGQQGIVTLDDETRVTLAPQTTLRLLNFSNHTRTVAVDGSAYFEVIHTAGAPFEVRSGTVTTQVLGTGFLVEHASRSPRVRVAVEEGKVRVSSALRPNAGVVVTSGYVSEVTDSTTTVSAAIDSTLETQWLNGRLVFYNAPVAVVLQTLTRWYGYQFRYADSTLPHRDVTIGLSMRSSASALATLEHILKVSLTVTGDTVTLTPQVDGRVKGIPRVRSYDVWTPTREVGR